MWLPADQKIPYKGRSFCELFKRLPLFSKLKPYFQQMTSPFRVFCLFVPFLFVSRLVAADSTTFPQPPELDRDVDFWISIFAEYKTTEGILHDNRNLGVVYESMPMPAGVSRRERNRRAQNRRVHYQAILRTLAGGKRDNLNNEEQRVLDLWPADVENSELQAAVGRIRYQQGLSDRFREGYIRSGRWRAHIENELSARGVPVELAALPHVESSYNPNARSHVGASGIWQFTRGTGRRFMQVDHVLDERNDPFLAATAAAELLAYNYSIAGNWPMAITAYNHGLAGARRAMRQMGDEEYVKILREYRGRAFGFASRNFYVAFLAAMHVDTNAEKYFPGIHQEAPVDYAVHTLDDYIAVDVFTDAIGVSENDFKRYNPALQATIFQGSKYLPKGFAVRVPESRLNSPIDDLVATIDAANRFDKQLPDLYHTVVRGDTLSEIADEYGTRVSTLVALNALGSSHRIRIGQQIRLPAAGPLPEVQAAAPAPAPSEPEPEPAPTVAVVTPITEAPAGAEIADATPAEAAEVDLGALADDVTSSVRAVVQTSLLSDPSDYTVAADNSIEVHPLETLGHFGDWLEIKTQRLRDINGLAFRTPVEVGQRIKLDLSKVDAARFEERRNEYHRQQQDEFFRGTTITGTREHVVKRGESVWILSLRQYGVPIWLFRQYNPGLDLHNVRPGTRLNFPVLVSNDAAS